EASYVVVDLETTGLRPGSSQICEVGAVLVQGFEIVDEFETLVDPRVPLGATVSALTGLTDRQLRGAPPAAVAVKRFLAFAGDSVLVAHNARFDLAFLDRETERLTGSRLAAPVVDTVALARRLLAGRVPRASLAQLSYFFGTSVQPCHRALPDAQATAEVLLALIGLAQERGARTVAELVALAAALEELRLIRELRPPANARIARPDRYVWLRKRGDAVVASAQPTSLGPIRSRRRAQLAARALGADELERPSLALPRIRRRLAELADARRYEDAARLRDRLQALEQVCRELERLARLRALERCIVAPGAEPGHARAFFIAGGRVAAERALPPGGGAHLEIEAGLAAARHALVSDTPWDLDELHLVGAFLRKPSPELVIVPLEKEAILAGARRVAAPEAVRRSPVRVSDTGGGPDGPRLFEVGELDSAS